MKRIILGLFIMSCVLMGPLIYPDSGKDYRDFNKGMVYLLIGDKALAASHFGVYFKMYADTALRGAYFSLIEKRDWDVTSQFKAYLDFNHRSIVALVGIALSTTENVDSTTIDNLDRARRLDPSFAATYLCLGMEYVKKKDYPQAMSYFVKGQQLARVPEAKILTARLHLLLDQPGNALALMKPEAEREADNFYFNFLAAQAYFQLNQLQEMEKYIETAVELNPTNNDAQLLYARFLLSTNDAKKAKSVLKNIKPEPTSKEYYMIYGQVLLELKDKNTKNFLDEVYLRSRWDKGVNFLMARYHLWKKEGNLQNWIYRSLLSGNDTNIIKENFPAETYRFPDFKYIPFFNVRLIEWITDDLLVIGAIKNSGDGYALFFIDPVTFVALQSFPIKGELQEFFFSKDRHTMIVTASAGLEEGVYVYGIQIAERHPSFRQVYNKPIPFDAIEAGFNRSGNLVYITDKRISQLGFVAPFAIVSDMGEKKPVYPEYPFPIYKYDFNTGQLFQLTDPNVMEKAPIDAVKKYSIVADTSESDDKVANLVSRGAQLNLTSTEIVKIFFSRDLESFIIYLSDLKNAFQAIICDNTNNMIMRVDETMFLGKDQYAEIQLLDFDPGKKEIIVLTVDNNKNLIQYNYQSYLYTVLTGKVLETHYDREASIFYALTERSKKSLYNETNLEIIKINPFLKTINDSRRDIDKLVFFNDHPNHYFSTFYGELLELGDDRELHYVGPSYEGSIYSASPSTQKTAAFINERLYIVDTELESYDVFKAAKEKKEKKQ